MSITDPTSVAVLSVAEMSAADDAAIAAGTAGAVLMERAGLAVAQAARCHARPGARVLVLCGPGNNGGDGFVAARLLRESGLAVTLILAGERSHLSGDAATMAALWPGAVGAPDDARPMEHDIVVDALFGAGLNRPLGADVARLVEAVNAASRPVIAVDMPSGVSGDTGGAQNAAIQATETVTFFRLKPGHLLFPGRSLCGRVLLRDIGIAPGLVFAQRAPTLFRNAPALWLTHWPHPAVEAHKFQKGAVLVLAAGLSGVGAPRLAARAALRIGAGLVTVACQPEALAAHAARGPDALIQRPLPDRAALETLLADRRLSAVLAGPALGVDAHARDLVTTILRATVPVVFDADALTILASRPQSLIQACEKRGGSVILTPHEGEFMRLFGSCDAILRPASKVERARRAAAFSGAVIVLKGADTVIAAPCGSAAINETGSSALATAGAGDVLGGLIAGLVAQRMPAFEAACAAVWLHGRAGEALGAGLIADDLPEAVVALLRSGEPFDASNVTKPAFG